MLAKRIMSGGSEGMRAGLLLLAISLGFGCSKDTTAVNAAAKTSGPEYAQESSTGAARELLNPMSKEMRERVEQWLREKPPATVVASGHVRDAFALEHMRNRREAWISQGKAIPGLQEALMQMLSEPGCDQQLVLLALGNVYPTKTAELMFQIAESQVKSSAMRGLAMRFLVLSGDPRAVDVLAAALADPDPEVRTVACMHLGLYRTERTRRLLENAISDESLEVSEAAASALRAP